VGRRRKLACVGVMCDVTCVGVCVVLCGSAAGGLMHGCASGDRARASNEMSTFTHKFTGKPLARASNETGG